MIGALPTTSLLVLAIAVMSLAVPADTRHIRGIEVDKSQKKDSSNWPALSQDVEKIAGSEDNLVLIPRVEQRLFQSGPRIPSHKVKRSVMSSHSAGAGKRRGAERRGGGGKVHTKRRFRGGKGKHARGGIFYRYEDIP